MKKFLTAAAVGAIALSMSANSAFARKTYFDEFVKKYPNVKAAATTKCGVCHEGTDKKMRNAYGKALGGALGAKDVKDLAKVTAAMDKIAADNAKFGDNLKAGKLPTE